MLVCSERRQQRRKEDVLESFTKQDSRRVWQQARQEREERDTGGREVKNTYSGGNRSRRGLLYYERKRQPRWRGPAGTECVLGTRIVGTHLLPGKDGGMDGMEILPGLCL